MAVNIPTVDDIRSRIAQAKQKVSSRVQEWRERGVRGQLGTHPLRNLVRRRMGFTQSRASQSNVRIRRTNPSRRQIRDPEDIQPAYTKSRSVTEEAEVSPAGRRKVAIEL